MRVFYRGPDALVTDREFVRLGTATAPFVVAELRHITIVRRRDRGWIGAAAPVAMAAATLLLAADWFLVKAPAVRLALATAAGLTVILATMARRPACRYDLCATYRGREVLLYTSPDYTTFHQVSRALRRSVEDADPGRAPHRLTAA